MNTIRGKCVGDELVILWGLKNCRDIKIHIPNDGIVTITAEFNATREQMDQVNSIVKKYQLEEIPKQEGMVV